MIQDIEPKIFNNQYNPKYAGGNNIEPNDYIISFKERNIYAKIADEGENNELEFLTYDEFIKNTRTKIRHNLIYLFTIEDEDYSRKYFLLFEEDEYELAIEGYSYIKMYNVRRMAPKYQVMAAATAWHLYVWYNSSRYCGKCGTPTVHDQNERMMRCPKCNNMIFPKVAPAVIVGVTNGDKILLTKYANREYKRYALIAGFNEIGENIEETVKREVMEEAGLHIKNIRYYKSQPWGFDSNLLMGFFCEVDGDKNIRMDEHELSEAEWVAREDIPEYGENLSLTHEMMQVFKKHDIRKTCVKSVEKT
jgi:NAD+ diphosphatase